MTEPSPPPGRSAADVRAATVRGLVVLGVAVAIGVVVYLQGYKGEKALDAANTTTTTSTIPLALDRDAAPTTTQPQAGTTVPKTPVTKVPAADVAVLVANGVDPSKVIAGPNAEKLRTAGYTVTGSVDLPTASNSSFVYYTGDLQPEAQAIAQVLGLPTSAATAMPTPPPTTLGNAEVLVVIGKDKA